MKVSSGAENTLFEKEVIGLKELRNNISDIFDRASNNFEEILTGNVKKGGHTVSIISTDLLCTLLESYKFNPVITFDEKTNQYEILINEIGAVGCGDSKEEALEMAVDNTLALAEDFFDELELYMRIDKYKKQHPYFMRINHCNTKKALLVVLGLEEIFLSEGN